MRSMVGNKRRQRSSAVVLLVLLSTTTPILGLNGGAPQLETFNGWKVFEAITEGDNPSDVWPLPGILDGAGAYLGSENELRIQVNHELATSATISEVTLHVPSLKTAINNMIRFNSLRGQKFMIGSRRAYDRYTLDAGKTWKSDRGNFRRFCSAQSYTPRKRGFVDQLYITGEETGRNLEGRLVAIHSLTRDMYILSGVTGASGEGNPGFPFDSFENAAWIDTKENNHIALVLSADYGSESLMLYVGKRGKGVNGQESNDVLARNGLAYGSWFFLKGTYPNLNQSNSGRFGTGNDGALSSDKMEDVDTSPSFPTRVVLGDQNTGVFILDFSLNFGGNKFNMGQSTFSIKKIANHIPNNNLNGADNADWTASTNLNGKSYPQGIIFMNEDTETGEIWQMTPDGGNKIRIGASKTGGESTGILDISELLDYAPGSIVLSNNFGSPEGDARNLPSAMQILINPDATEANSQPFPQPVTAPPQPQPVPAPVPAPTRRPTAKPVPSPTRQPTLAPVPAPTRRPTRRPTPVPIPSPTSSPVSAPRSPPSQTADAASPTPLTSASEPVIEPVSAPAETTKAATTSVPQGNTAGETTGNTPTLVDATNSTEGADARTEGDSILRGSFNPRLATLAVAAAAMVIVVGILSVLISTVQRKRNIAARKRFADISFDVKTETSSTIPGGREVEVYFEESSA